MIRVPEKATKVFFFSPLDVREIKAWTDAAVPYLLLDPYIMYLLYPLTNSLILFSLLSLIHLLVLYHHICLIVISSTTLTTRGKKVFPLPLHRYATAARKPHVNRGWTTLDVDDVTSSRRVRNVLAPPPGTTLPPFSLLLSSSIA